MKGFRCLSCSKLSHLSTTFCYYCYCREGQLEESPGLKLEDTNFSVEDNTNVEDTNFRISESDENAAMTQKDILTKTKDVNFQEQVTGLDALEQNSAEIDFIVTSDSSVNKGGTMFAGTRGGESNSGMFMVSEEFDVSLTQKDSSFLNLSSGYRHNLASSDTIYFQNNDKTMESNPDYKKRRDEIYSEGGENCLNYSQQRNKPVKLKATSLIDNSYLACIEKKLSSGIADSGTSKENVDDMPSVPGPSGIQGNVNPRNLCAEISKSIFPRKLCNLCKREYIEGYSHDSEHLCRVCPEIFQCRTQYNEHLVEHDFIKRCWVCTNYIKDHFNVGNKLYECCACPQWKSDNLANLISHNYNHRPEILCKKCGKEIIMKEKRFHGCSFRCSMCPNKFDCKVQLEEHYDTDHKDDLGEKCMLCNDKKSDHVKKNKNETIHQCCECLEEFKTARALQNHLQKYLDLKLYTCNKCEKRFARPCTEHTKNCIPLPYRCEICNLRFPSEDSMHEHLFANHTRF